MSEMSEGHWLAFWVVVVILWFVIAGAVGGHMAKDCPEDSVECDFGSFVQGIAWPITLPYLLGTNLFKE